MDTWGFCIRELEPGMQMWDRPLTGTRVGTAYEDGPGEGGQSWQREGVRSWRHVPVVDRSGRGPCRDEGRERRGRGSQRALA